MSMQDDKCDEYLSDLPSAWKTGGGAMRFRARLMYDGLASGGLQFQNTPSVTGKLQAALSKSTRQNVRVIAAVCTDTGAHARGHAIHFDLDGSRFSDGPEKLQHAVNCMLPHDVRLVYLERAPERDAKGRKWHSFYWATGELYSYRFFSGPFKGGVMDPTQRLYRHQGQHPLCLDRMQRAADCLVGEHDFASFANGGNPLLTTVRRVQSITIHDEGNFYARVEVHVNWALYEQVRNMVGLLFEVGDGRREVADVSGLLARRSRRDMPEPAPACGLTLESVYYNVGWGGAFSHQFHTDTLGFGTDAGGGTSAKSNSRPKES